VLHSISGTLIRGTEEDEEDEEVEDEEDEEEEEKEERGGGEQIASFGAFFGGGQ